RAVDDDEMQSHAQRRQAAGTRDRVGCSSTAYHEAGRRQDALRVRQLDGFVDLRRCAEIVRRDDQRFQCAASRRSRRKWKNSIPSRSRRFIISGLFAISPTMEAILLLRK